MKQFSHTKLLSASWRALFFLLLFAYWANSLNAQAMELQVVGNSGGVQQAGSGTLHWTVGELVITEKQNGNILPQGFHQIMVYYTVPSVEPQKPSISIKIYPNPAAEFVSIEADQAIIVNMRDLLGRLVISSCIPDLNQILDLTKLPSGTYFLEVSEQGGKHFKIFKIVHI